MASRYEESIVVSKRLQKECGKDLTAEAHMAVSYLGIGDYKKAAKLAQKNTDESPDEGYIASFALAELNDMKNALEHFVYAALNSPHTARILLMMKKRNPKGYSETSDHNSGVYLLSELGS